MDTYSTAAAGQLRGGAIPAKPISQMEMHAQNLASSANRLNEQISRLSGMIDRFCGPLPPSKLDGTAESAPTGVLVVAQFEARRVAEGLDRLTDQINRLDSIA